MRSYEFLGILNSEIPEEEIDSTTEKIKEIITKQGGEVKNIKKWGKRRLAFEVKKTKKGFYVLLRFVCEPKAMKEINRDMKFVEGIQRYMIVVLAEGANISEFESDFEQREEAVQ